MSPDIRPSNPPENGSGWYFVEKPIRNDRLSKERWIKNWFDHIQTDWPRLTQAAYESLSKQDDTALKPDLLTPESKDEMFRFNRYDMAVQIVTIGIPVDIGSVLRYFQIGSETRQTVSEQKSGQKAYRVSRAELFQIFIAVLAKVEISPETKSRKRKTKKLNRARDRFSSRSSIKLKTKADETLSQEQEPELKIESSEIELIPTIEVEPLIHPRVLVIEKQGIQKIEYRPRPPITDFETQEEVDRLMRKKPERGGPMLNVR